MKWDLRNADGEGDQNKKDKKLKGCHFDKNFILLDIYGGYIL
jgi:hypothetical protein